MSALLLSLISTYRYLIIPPFAIIEGTVTALIVGFFISLGTLNFGLAYLALLSGDLIPDAILYYIGRYGNKNSFLIKYAPKIGLTSNIEKSLNHLWFNHGKKTFIFSKLAYGIAVPILISAGLVKYPFKKFIGYCTIISGLKVLIVVFVGFYLGHSYKVAIKYIDYFYVVMTIVFVVLIIVYFYFTKKMKKKFIELEKEVEIS